MSHCVGCSTSCAHPLVYLMHPPQVTVINRIPADFPQVASGISIHWHGFWMWKKAAWWVRVCESRREDACHKPCPLQQQPPPLSSSMMPQAPPSYTHSLTAPALTQVRWYNISHAVSNPPGGIPQLHILVPGEVLTRPPATDARRVCVAGVGTDRRTFR